MDSALNTPRSTLLLLPENPVVHMDKVKSREPGQVEEVKAKHEHKWERRIKYAAVHEYRRQQGKMVRGLITAKDKLTMFVCECGAQETVNLERTDFGYYNSQPE